MDESAISITITNENFSNSYPKIFKNFPNFLILVKVLNRRSFVDITNFSLLKNTHTPLIKSKYSCESNDACIDFP